MSVSPSRRRLLQAALLAPVAAACTSHPPRPGRVDPDVALRSAAVARERALLATYAGAAPSAAVTAIRAEHEQHLAALGAPSPSPASSGSPAPTTVAQLVEAERTAAAAHAAAAVTASPALAAVLASLAASEASHPVGLL